MEITSRISRSLMELPEAIDIRQEVFVEEQGFSGEFDDIDNKAVHAVIYVDGEPAAAGRAFFENDPKEIHIGRICVLPQFRKNGLGSEVMSVLEEEAVKLGASSAVLSAQVRASDFYKKLGYTAFGNEYYDEYCPHVSMRKTLGE